MAFGLTTYSDPSSYIQEVLVPGGINIPAQPFAVCLVGTGSRNKRVTNEAVLRGEVTDEALTVAASSPHTATLANRALRRLETTSVFKTLNGIETVIPDSYVRFNAAFVLGTVTSTVNLSTNNAFALEVDGRTSITLVLHDVPAQIAAASSIVFSAPDADGIQTVTVAGQTFITNGIRPGTTALIQTAEDAVNDGTFTVVDVLSETAFTILNADGLANVDDDGATIDFSGTGALGREVHPLYNFSSISAATITEIAAAINQALSSDIGEDLGFGSSYANVASVSSSALRITSASVDSEGYGLPASDVSVFAPMANSALVAIFGAASTGNRDAETVITINDLAWHASATWTADYVRLVDDVDPLAQSDIQRIVAVGSSPGTTNYAEGESWNLDGDTIDWSPDAAAVVTGIAGAAAGDTFDVNPGDQLVLRVDSKTSTISGTTSITIDLNALALYPLGYDTSLGGTGNTAAASELATNINAVLAAQLGPRYLSVATSPTVNGTPRVRLTSPTEGRAGSSIEIVAASANSAHTTIFSAESVTLGTGSRPAIGSVYYVSYDYTRPTTDYDVPFRHFSIESVYAQIGQPSIATARYNPLAIAAELCFENGAQFIYTVQINDDTTEGTPSRPEVLSALNGAGTIAGTSEMVLVDSAGTSLTTTVDLLAHLEEQNGPIEKHYRRGWFGCARNTPMGDRDTVESLVGRSTRTLQVAASSPARGRMFMIAPPQVAGVSRTEVLDDGTETRINLDGTYVASAWAARRTALLSPADTLTRRIITGFNTDDITAPWTPAQRRFMAGQGVFVTTYDAGRFMVLDAMSTEGGGGGLTAFKVDSTSYQKDIIVTKVNQALDANIVGIVPFDLAAFVLEIKLVIQGVISGEIAKGTIGPYRDKETGATRPLDPRIDIRVSQNVNDPTTYDFSFYFFLRYPALRLFGQYSVDAPFWNLAAA